MFCFHKYPSLFHPFQQLFIYVCNVYVCCVLCNVYVFVYVFCMPIMKKKEKNDFVSVTSVFQIYPFYFDSFSVSQLYNSRSNQVFHSIETLNSYTCVVAMHSYSIFCILFLTLSFRIVFTCTLFHHIPQGAPKTKVIYK